MTALDDALLAARLCARDPAGLGGMVLRGGGDGARDEVLAALHEGLPAGAPLRRVPGHVDDDRLLGGLDLAATLSGGAAILRPGLLAETDGGLLVLPMAERLSDSLAARIAGALDRGETIDGSGRATTTRFAVAALDDGDGPDEHVALALSERLAFHVDLTGERPGGATIALANHPAAVRPASDAILAAFAATAAALGVDSARAALFALRAARAAASLDGREDIDEEDVVLAARLVLAPRATRLPPDDESPEEEAAPPRDTRDGDDDGEGEPQALDDVVLAATRAALPADVLARIAAGAGRQPSRSRGAGERRRSPSHGRPLGARPGLPRGGARLSLIDTLRAAAPWQRRRRAAAHDGPRVRIRRDDLRIRRFETRAEAVTIFAVDASGSAALTRLSEAKGAVELLLAEAYVKRAQVALVAFRGASADLLLPPTRSLARARRSLAELPGGGGTPLAAGLDAARALAEAARARGRTPLVVVLTDGRANVAADGGTSRRAAEDDATVAARAFASAGIAAVFVDISPRPRPEGAALAGAMKARYLPLPRADAATMHAAVRAARP